MKSLTALLLALLLLTLTACAPAAQQDTSAPASTDSSSSSTTSSQPSHDESAYQAMTVAQARDAAQDTLIKLEGIVTAITYSNGCNPSGIYLADNTNSIAIHDQELAKQVQVGNRITVLGEKAYWILDSEVKYAQQFGYQGSCQLENAVLLSNDNRTDNAYDHSWIQETTVKEIMDTPLSENITTTTFKVQALIDKRAENDYTNYYFLDLDGKTGSYAYSQSDGDDFAWLDPYDGKICTVYLSVINAKSTEGGCLYRLQPIQVFDEGYTFDLAATAEHVVKYYALGQFQSSYSGDPALELVTKVSSKLLGFEDATITYQSSDPSILKFQKVDDKVYLRGVQPGTVTVTITGNYLETSYTHTMEITIGQAQIRNYCSVSDAIAAEDGTTVSVKGIVGPRLVNQPGFYLMDDGALIAVNMDTNSMEGLRTGHEVIIEGVRSTDNPKGGSCHGQTCIKTAAVVSNAYGSHAYNDSYFITGKTLQDFYSLDGQEDHSTSVYVLKGTVEIVKTAYYSNVKFMDGGTSINLYCADAAQYAFLEEYNGQEVTLEIAPCNWNSKAYYAGCVLAIRTEDGKIVHELQVN